MAFPSVSLHDTGGGPCTTTPFVSRRLRTRPAGNGASPRQTPRRFHSRSRHVRAGLFSYLPGGPGALLADVCERVFWDGGECMAAEAVSGSAARIGAKGVGIQFRS